MQRQYDTTILAIRSDNGSEFKNYTMDEFLSDEGIKHQYSAAGYFYEAHELHLHGLSW